MSSVGGSVVGAVIGGFLEQLAPLIWIFWTQLIVGGFVQALHFFTVPETRSTLLLDREAKKRRKNGDDVWGPTEVRPRLTFRQVMTIWGRPFYMLFTEPIVAWLSAVSGEASGCRLTMSDLTSDRRILGRPHFHFPSGLPIRL